MRTLLLFLKYIVVTAGIAAGVFLLGREAYLLYTIFRVEQDLTFLKLRVKNPGTVRDTCSTRFPDVRGRSALTGFQLRFTDDVEYKLEAVCSFHDSDPLFIRSAVLPKFVKKVPGSPGVLLLLDASYAGSFTVDLFGRRHTFSVAYDRGNSSIASDSQRPVTSCGGWGYTCCDTVSQVATGNAPSSAVLDCSTCRSQCKDRPGILAFRSDPPADPATQTTVLTGGDTAATFSYTVSDNGSGIREVRIQYGDGVEDTSQDMQGSFTHTYTCPGEDCMYTAEIAATGKDGVSSPRTRNSSIVVRVR